MKNNKSQLNYKPVQLTLPVHYEHIIDPCDPVVSFYEVVGGLNLKQYINTSNMGRQEYDPEMMLHLVLFGFMENNRSLRDLEKACKTDIRFMYIAKGATPSFMAFQRFITQKLNQSIDDIFYAINQFLIEKENINTDVLFIDGTKIEANATKFSFVWRKSVLNYRGKLYKKITKEFEAINKNLKLVFSPKDAYTSACLETPLQTFKLLQVEGKIEFVHGKGKRKTAFQRHFEALFSYYEKLVEYEKHIEICGNRNSYSKTDHDATFMHGKEDYYNKTGIFKPYYNYQLGVSDEYILHLGIYQNPTDTKTFIPFMESFKNRYGFLPKKPVADAGYGGYDNYMYCLNNGMKLMMKYNLYSKEKTKKYQKDPYRIKNMEVTPERIIASDGTVYHYSHDYENRKGIYPQIKQVYVHENWTEEHKAKKIPQTISRDVVLLELQGEAKRNLDSEEGIQLKIQRSIQVEGAFGDIKHNSDYDRVQRRGLRRVQTELTLVSIGYNLRKYHAKKYRVLH